MATTSNNYDVIQKKCHTSGKGAISHILEVEHPSKLQFSRDSSSYLQGRGQSSGSFFGCQRNCKLFFPVSSFSSFFCHQAVLKQPVVDPNSVPNKLRQVAEQEVWTAIAQDPRRTGIQGCWDHLRPFLGDA